MQNNAVSSTCSSGLGEKQFFFFLKAMLPWFMRRVAETSQYIILDLLPVICDLGAQFCRSLAAQPWNFIFFFFVLSPCNTGKNYDVLNSKLKDMLLEPKKKEKKYDSVVQVINTKLYFLFLSPFYLFFCSVSARQNLIGLLLAIKDDVDKKITCVMIALPNFCAGCRNL